jgi:hypothetical protein
VFTWLKIFCQQTLNLYSVIYVYIYFVNNEEFFGKFCAPGLVVLIGGSAFIDRSIKKAQKKITKNKTESLFSHAFLVSEKRIDGKWWVIESDLEIYRKQVRLGVQENRIEKYFDDKMFPNVAILEFKLSKKQTEIILKEALDIVSSRAKYSLREIFGVLFSFTNESERKKENRFSQENSFICSTFVQHCYGKADINFNESVSLKNMTPEDIYSTLISHTKEKIIREK